ncbi:MAG: PQQ-binding-like beta-propeller repeat protein [Bacteroidales bacterium]|nr:PQQ-binding-like beta-propeller repeat protein [Bacteroidales bacterium]
MAGIYLLFSFLFLIGSASSSDSNSRQWTRFRGADGHGIDTIGIAPTSWEESDYLWNIVLPGNGHASPVVWDDLIFVTSSDDESDLGYVMAFNEQNGDLLWQKEFKVTDLTMHKDNNLAAPSPAVDGSRVYVIWYGKEHTSLAALSHEGSLQWQAEFGGIEARHGGGSSLMLTDKYVIFTREQEETSSQKSSWVAVNKQTGKTAWELERESAARNSFSTPILVHNNNSEALLIFTSEAHGFTAVDPESGEVLWERKSLLTHRVVASPICANGMIVACRKGETVVLEVDAYLTPVADSARYSFPPNLSPYVPTPIVVGELLYLFMDNGTVACVELASGKLLWKERPAGPIYGSPICVSGNLYCMTKEGKVIVIRAHATYELLGVHALGDESFSTPVMSTSGMVFRTFTRLMMLGNSG